MENSSTLSLKSLSSDEINKIEEFRKSKQTAVLAILFSDIVNSTYATEKLGEQTFSKLRHIHDELFKRIMCRDNAGIIIKEIGDSFLCVFAEPSTAVLRAVEFQRAINSNIEHLTIQGYTLTVKIGIHVGQVAVENSLALDIFGRHVNRAARIQAIANGGQILTSQSIWENAVGWLKDNNEEKIGWISYGKTKLKGIDERVDIFGFYPKEIGKSPTPKIIRKRKQNKILLLLIGFAVIAGLSFIMVKKITREATVLPTARKIYYVQFDFSEIAKQAQDTLAISESLLSQIIAVLNPDSVITESDLTKSLSRKGKWYAKHFNNKSEENVKYFRDTLNISGGTIFITPESDPQVGKDSIMLHTIIAMHHDDASSSGVSWSDSRNVLSLDRLENDFRKKLLEELMSTRLWSGQGNVVSTNGNIVLFRLAPNAKLREGAVIRFSRIYVGVLGLKKRLNDIERQIAYYKDKNDSLSVKDCYELFVRDEKKISQSDSSDRWGFHLDLYGKVIELYDTTGKATWTLTGKYPFEKPEAGDEIYLAY